MLASLRNDGERTFSRSRGRRGRFVILYPRVGVPTPAARKLYEIIPNAYDRLLSDRVVSTSERAR